MSNDAFKPLAGMFASIVRSAENFGTKSATDVSPVPGILDALRGLTRWSRAEHVEKVSRPQLRAWCKTVLADYCRRGLEIVELTAANDELVKRVNQHADDARPTVVEWDALRASYERSQEIAHGLIVERDTAREGATLRGVRLAEVLDERDALRAELDLLRETCHARGEFIVVRLSGIRPEVLPVSTWQEDADGTVVVEARPEGGGDK